MKSLLSSISVMLCFGPLLLVACGSSPATPSVTVLPTATSTVAASATPTLTPTLTPTTTPTPTSTPTQTATPTSTPIPPLVKVCFFYDKNLNNHQDADEPLLSELDVSSNGYYETLPDGCVMVPQNGIADLRVTGYAPNEKQLLNATFLEPHQIVLLPRFTYEVGTQDAVIGLVDGYCSAPITPGELNWESYNDVLNNPSWFENHIEELHLYPPHCLPEAPEADAEPNWFFYGYCNHWNPTARHRAFDIWAKEGISVHAPVPGRIVKGNYDHAIGIRGPYGQVDLNHIHPSVKIGDTVKRGDVVATVDSSWHVHMELYTPHNARAGNPLILICFPGLTPGDILVSPTDGKPVPVLPYFGP